jgi:prophage regulatory protein
MTEETIMVRKILKRSEVRRRTGLSNFLLEEGVLRGSFPAPIVLGPKSHRWYEDEVEAWTLALNESRNEFVRERVQRREDRKALQVEAITLQGNASASTSRSKPPNAEEASEEVNEPKRSGPREVNRRSRKKSFPWQEEDFCTR